MDEKCYLSVQYYYQGKKIYSREETVLHLAQSHNCSHVKGRKKSRHHSTLVNKEVLNVKFRYMLVFSCPGKFTMYTCK